MTSIHTQYAIAVCKQMQATTERLQSAFDELNALAARRVESTAELIEKLDRIWSLK